MQNLLRIIAVVASIVIIFTLLFTGYQNKKYGNPNLEKPSHEIIRIGDKDDYYQFRIPREFLPDQSKDNTQAVLMKSILYPEMKRWKAEPREIRDVISYISLKYHTREFSHLNKTESVLNNGIKRYNFLIKPTDEISKEMVRKYPEIKVYANKKTREVEYYVFKAKNGDLVYSSIDLKSLTSSKISFSSRVNLSYKGKFEIEFMIPKKYLYEMPEVVNAVIDLISTFEPKRYQKNINFE
jgi:hypothetical protein